MAAAVIAAQRYGSAAAGSGSAADAGRRRLDAGVRHGPGKSVWPCPPPPCLSTPDTPGQSTPPPAA